MRITIFQGAFLPVPPLRGGAVEKMWFELGKQFSHQGHSVCHVSRCFSDLPTQELIDGVSHIRIKGYDTPSSMLKLKWLDLLYSLRGLSVLPPSDILITNTFWLPFLASWSQRRLGKIMVDVQRMPKGQIWLYSQAACLRANSNAVQQEIIRQVPSLGGRTCNIPNPLPFLPPPLLKTERKPIILYCGRLHPEKGIELLINAFAQACALGLHGWTLRLVGPVDTAAGGGGEPWLSRLLASRNVLGLPIEWLGPIYDNGQLLSHYQKAAIFVYPSLAEQGETFGLAPLEAMACGAVPIVSALACFRDFITPGHNGLVFNHRTDNAPGMLASKIIELTSNPKQLASMGQAALSVRQTHHPTSIATVFLQYFEELIKQRYYT
jgi:glycosyltransferase involved in cell wall biosynthesis